MSVAVAADAAFQRHSIFQGIDAGSNNNFDSEACYSATESVLRSIGDLGKIWRRAIGQGTNVLLAEGVSDCEDGDN